MKTKIWWYIAGVFFFCIIFEALYFQAFYKSYQEKDKPGEQKVQQSQQEETVPVNRQEENTLSEQTKYLCVIYNKDTQQIERKEGKIAQQFVGWKREDMERYLANYMKKKNGIEGEEGLVAYEMLAFSSDMVCVEKIYEDTSSEYKYRMVVEDNEIVVYDEKWENLVEKTGIDVRNLSQEEQEKLVQGMLIKDEETLYGILEDYSS